MVSARAAKSLSPRLTGIKAVLVEIYKTAIWVPGIIDTFSSWSSESKEYLCISTQSHSSLKLHLVHLATLELLTFE